MHALVLLAAAALSSDAPADPPPARPFRYAALEVNPIAPLAGRVGGQLEIGIVGPLVLNAGASRVSFPATQHYSQYDEDVLGNPAVKGWALEIGPRVYFPLGRQDTTVHAHVMLAASFAGDLLRQDGSLRCPNGSYGCTTGGGHDVTRSGVAIDAGVNVSLGAGFYVLVGLGHQWMGKTSGLANHPASSAPIPDFAPSSIQRESRWPRLLFSVGWGI